MIIGDSAYPVTGTAGYPPHVDGWGFYIGGDTPHVWTDAEIAALPYQWVLPIYVRSNPTDQVQAINDANEAVTWAQQHHQPAGTLIALDFETAINSAYVTAFDHVVTNHGYKTVLYGSLSALRQNPKPSGGYWAADWTGVEHLVPGSEATQYISDQMIGEPWDLSVTADGIPLWDRVQRPEPAPTPVPVPVPAPQPNPAGEIAWRATHNIYTPVRRDGVAGQQTWRALQYVLGVTADGVFGNVSTLKLQQDLNAGILGLEPQASHNMFTPVAQDGAFGPKTWEAFQAVLGVTVDGQPGFETISALQRLLNQGAL